MLLAASAAAATAAGRVATTAESSYNIYYSIYTSTTSTIYSIARAGGRPAGGLVAAGAAWCTCVCTSIAAAVQTGYAPDPTYSVQYKSYLELLWCSVCPLCLSTLSRSLSEHGEKASKDAVLSSPYFASALPQHPLYARERDRWALHRVVSLPLGYTHRVYARPA